MDRPTVSPFALAGMIISDELAQGSDSTYLA